MNKKLHIGVLTGRQPYPDGMAAAQRIHMMARAMSEAGAEVNVWVDGLDGCNEPRNSKPVGVKDGIPYEYLLGKTQANQYRWRRVLDRFAMALASRRKLSKAARGHELDGLYFYTSILKPDFERLIVYNNAKTKRFPVVIDLCEAPWTFKPNQTVVEKRMSPLWGADGVICISRLLEIWVNEENKRTGCNVRSLYVPILVDINEIVPARLPPIGKTVLFAGSPLYDNTLRFLLSVMELVWKKHSDCSLVITGGTTESTLGAAVKGKQKNIRYAGYVKRRELLREYSEASVLVIPLFDDVRSHARFPTKLGEYLASGLPVVTNRVGEIPQFLEDGVNACITEPGDTSTFAKAICRLLEQPASGQPIGQEGRRVAEQHFHYANYGAKLCEFFSSLKLIKANE